MPFPARALVIATLLVVMLGDAVVWGGVRTPAQTVSCETFPNQSAAQGAYRQNPVGLRHLDPDRAGVACRTLPCPCDFELVRPVLDLSDAVLTLADLPPGWSAMAPGMSGSGFRICGEEQGPSGNGDAVEVRFQRSQSGPFVFQSLLPLPPGYGPAAMMLLRDIFHPCEWDEFDPEGGIAAGRLSDLPFPGVGDDHIALRLDLEMPVFSLQGDIVVIRRGDAVAILVHLAAGAPVATVDSALTESLARLIDERLAAITGG